MTMAIKHGCLGVSLVVFAVTAAVAQAPEAKTEAECRSQVEQRAIASFKVELEKDAKERIGRTLHRMEGYCQALDFPRAQTLAAEIEPVIKAAPLRVDDLKRIRGITADIEPKLKAAGVANFADIAGWSVEDRQRFETQLGLKNKVEQENWIEQAQILAKGGDTAFSRRYARGDIDPKTSAPIVRAIEDDLKRVRGIGVIIENKLKGMGVTKYAQIAAWTQADIDKMSTTLDFKGRIERENWVEQAKILAPGGSTDFSRRVDRGEIEVLTPQTATAQAAAAAAAAAVRAGRVSTCQASIAKVGANQIRFEPGQAAFAGNNTSALDRVAGAIMLCDGPFKFRIEGHTDSDNASGRNQALSEARARAVVEHLVKSGFDAARLRAVGLGDSKPIAPNDTPENKARNRRIEFVAEIL